MKSEQGNMRCRATAKITTRTGHFERKVTLMLNVI